MRYSTYEPAPAPGLAAKRHRDGFSCKTAVAYTYDANGHRRWCIDCGTELGEQSWHPEGADVHPRINALVLALAMALVLCLAGLYLVTGGISAGPPVPSHTPTTYGPPPTVVP